MSFSDNEIVQQLRKKNFEIIFRKKNFSGKKNQMCLKFDKTHNYVIFLKFFFLDQNDFQTIENEMRKIYLRF